MTPQDFERLLDETAQILTENVRTNSDYRNPAAFERHALDMLKVAARNCALTVEPSFHPHAFPDIRANGYGIEVKYTKHDSWQAVGNSIFEGMRDPDVESVYVLFGKIGGEPEVRWGRYEDCITHVRVSHSPRFVIEMESDRPPLFAHMEVGYDDFARLDVEGKMLHVREYSRSWLKPGERLWWLEPSHSVPLNVVPYVDLPQMQQRVLRAEAALLCPQVCGPSRGPFGRRKYVDPAIYLLMHHGVIAPQTRDLFSAGSVAQDIDAVYDGEPYVSRALRGIENLMIDSALRLEDTLFQEYWGEGCPPDRRIAEWLRRADEAASDWVPSDTLFSTNS